jgi:hypothetical protein
MKKISLEESIQIQGGTFASGLCAGLTIGGGIYQAGIIANLWNPVGAIAGAAYVLATAGACSYAAME